MKIVADDRIPFLKGVFEPYAEVVYLPGAKIDREALKDADALIVRTRTKCSRELLAGTSVRIVATATIGFDHIDTEALNALGIEWRNAPGCNADSVKNYIASALVHLGDPAGKALGIIGVGQVGSRVAAVGRALGMRVLLNDPPRAAAEGKKDFVGLDELLAEADIVTLHVPLVRDGQWPTVNMVDEAFFARMKRGSAFFNSCRGEAMDAEAFKQAVRSGKIAASLIDVWPGEPDLDREMAAMVTFGTSHIAGYSKDGKANGTAASVRTVAKFLGIDALANWRPSALPEPVYPPEITVDGQAPLFEQIRQAVLHAYDLKRDDQALRENLNAFETLRGSYWCRREFSAYTVYGASAGAAVSLKLLGFQVR